MHTYCKDCLDLFSVIWIWQNIQATKQQNLGPHRTIHPHITIYVIIQLHISYIIFQLFVPNFCRSFYFRLRSCTTVRTDKVSSLADRSSILLTGQLGTASWGRVSVHMSRTPGVDSCIFPSIRSTSCSSGQPWSPQLIDGHQLTPNGSWKCAVLGTAHTKFSCSVS